MQKLLFIFLFSIAYFTGFSQKIDKAKIQALYDEIKAEGILHPEFVVAQSMQETGNLNCKKCCLRYNNLFGFYVKNNQCKKFKSREDCIEYYKDWQKKRYEKWRKKYPKEDYYHFLKYVKYATGDKYTRELKPKVAWVKKHLIL